jgi:hypothetical protein
VTRPIRTLESFTENERAVIVERNTGWEGATVATLAAVFDTEPRVIRAILRLARIAKVDGK